MNWYWACWLAVALLMVIGGIWARECEKKEWNGGRCPRCGRPWVNFDMDSQGGRGYVCRPCDEHIGISYAVDKPAEGANG